MDWEPYFELWKESESIAIHFNELLLTLRTQALAAIAATVAILVGLLAHNKVVDDGVGKQETSPATNWSALAASFFVLSMLWLALATLDLKYYHKLLEGSVQGILELEKRSLDIEGGTVVNISHHIRYAADRREEYLPDPDHMAASESNKFESTPAVNWFYGIVLVTLLGGFSFAAIRRLYVTKLWKTRKQPQRIVYISFLPVLVSAFICAVFWFLIAA